MYGKSYKIRRTNRGRTYRAGSRTGRSMVKNAYAPKRTSYGRRTISRSLKRETKFMDDYLSLAAWKQKTQAGNQREPGFTNWVLGGTMTKSDFRVAQWKNGGGRVQAPVDIAVPNCLSNIESGTTASTRIGNLIEPRYITVKGVVTAAMTTLEDDPETTNREGSMGTAARYCRTSLKVMVIRDKSMNEQGFVDFTDVFETPNSGIAVNTNAYLWNRRIDTMGRYEILKQMECDLDQDDPQKCFNWTIGLNGKQIRYNGSASGRYTRLSVAQEGWTHTNATTVPPTTDAAVGMVNFGASSSDNQSMTNGIYILAVATNITPATSGQIASPTLSMSTRVGFYDN